MKGLKQNFGKNWIGGNKGWFRKYLDYRFDKPITQPLSELELAPETMNELHPDKELYYLLQPTGLLYGFPFHYPFSDLKGEAIFPNINYRQLVKIVFTESLLGILVADLERLLPNGLEKALRFPCALNQALTYFLKIPDNEKSINEQLPKNINWVTKWEKWTDQKLKQKNKWVGISYGLPNCLLFLEMILCVEDQRRKLNLGAQDLNTEYLYLDLFKIIHNAILMDGKIADQEEVLLEQFIASAPLTSRTKKYMKNLIRTHSEPEEMEAKSTYPWLVRRFYQEIATLFTMADRELDKNEENFLKTLGNTLSLQPKEVEESILALEVFITHNEKHFTYVTAKNSLKGMRKDIQEKAKRAANRNKESLYQEIRESQELYQLLIKARTIELTPDEKEKVRSQLMDILKTIPVFVIISLPGTFMTLPFLISILPNQYFPTAFQKLKEESLKEREEKNDNGNQNQNSGQS